MGGSIIHERKPAKWLTFILAFTIMQASRFNYLFLVGGKKYIFNAISEAIVSLPVNAALDEANNSAILSRYKMQVESSEHDSINLQQKINAISKAFGNVADLNVIITDKCNLQCPSCFNSQSMHRGENFLQLLDVLKHKLTFLCNLYDCGKVKKVSISISGGEPLLFRDRVSSVVKICESILDQRAHDYLIMTNGTLLTHDVICQLNDIGIKDFYISIDANRYSLLEHNNVCRVQTSFQNLCASAKLIYSVTGKKPILRINVSSIDDTFPIDAISELYKYGLSTSVILDFKRWYNNAEPGNYYDFLPNRIQELIQNAHNRGFECLWRWYDNIDKYLACRVDTGLGFSIHPNGELSICPYTFDYVNSTTCKKAKCQTCCFLPICFGGCGYKSSDVDYCDFKMIQKALETHVLVGG